MSNARSPGRSVRGATVRTAHRLREGPLDPEWWRRTQGQPEFPIENSIACWLLIGWTALCLFVYLPIHIQYTQNDHRLVLDLFDLANHHALRTGQRALPEATREHFLRLKVPGVCDRLLMIPDSHRAAQALGLRYTGPFARLDERQIIIELRELLCRERPKECGKRARAVY